jgi:hypothetical protein
MLYRAVASAIMASILSSAKKEVIEVAKSRLLEQSMEDARKAMLSHVAQKYTEEVEYNVSQYIRALSESNVEIEFKGKPGEALITRAESAIQELEIYIEKQNPDGPIIQYLQRRYKEEGVRIITGRLYGGHYVNRKSQGIYEIMNKMGYAADVDKRKPWLTGEKTRQGLEDLVVNAALEIFEITFDNVDLSDEMANMKFAGNSQPKSSGEGFGARPTPKTPRRKKRR